MYDRDIFAEIEEIGGNFDLLEETEEEGFFELDESELLMELEWLKEAGMEFGGYRFIPLPGEDNDDALIPEGIRAWAYQR